MRYSLALLIFLLSSLTVFAVSSQEAINFVQSGQFAQSTETLQLFPETQIQHDSAPYWVITITRGTQVQDYLALKDGNKLSVETALSKNQSLFKTAAVLRSFSDVKNTSAAQNQWFFTRVNAQYFSQVANAANSRKNDLALVRDKITAQTTLTRITTIENLLKSIEEKSNFIAGKLDESLRIESAFYSNPKTNELTDFQDAFDLDSELMGLKTDLETYSSNLNPLLNAIASDPTLDDSSKVIKTKLLATPEEFKRFNDRFNQYTSNAESIDSLFLSAAQKSVSSSQNVPTRVKRSEASFELNNRDDVLLSKTNSSWATLLDASSAISGKDYRDHWKNQAGVKEFENHYQNALSSFNQGQYDYAISEAKAAKTSAVSVFKAGLESETVDPNNQGIDSALLTNILWLILGIAFVIVVLPKILAFLQQPPQANQ